MSRSHKDSLEISKLIFKQPEYWEWGKYVKIYGVCYGDLSSCCIGDNEALKLIEQLLSSKGDLFSHIELITGFFSPVTFMKIGKDDISALC